MAQENKYTRVIKTLQNNTPVLNEKEKLVGNIMGRIQKVPEKPNLTEMLDKLLFGWIDNFGLRLAMASLTVFLVGFFIVEQALIQNRLNHLEKQLIKTENTINKQELEPGVMQRVMLKMALREQTKGDSITVSVDDMDELLKSYLELLEAGENNKRTFVPESFLKKKTREREHTQEKLY